MKQSTYRQFVNSYAPHIEFVGSFTKKGITKRVYIFADRYEAKSFANKNYGNVIGNYIIL